MGNSVQKSTHFREKLLERRRLILNMWRERDQERQQLERPEIEFEETAAKQSLSEPMEPEDDLQAAEIEAIDAALGKIESGGYGICENCGRTISEARLEALPWTPLCEKCARDRQAPLAGGAARAAVPLAASASSGIRPAASDEETVEMIDDEIARDGRIEAQELHISCRNGVVYLDGVLPARAEHDVLVSIIEDVLSIKDYVDRIRIDRLPWERRSRTEGKVPAPAPEGETAREGEESNTDVFQSIDQGFPLDPPDEFTPENER